MQKDLPDRIRSPDAGVKILYRVPVTRHEGLWVVYLELGVGSNTPGIMKYPFWQMTAENPKAAYVCINYGEAVCPKEIEKQAISDCAFTSLRV